jgi:hypothetical protein
MDAYSPSVKYCSNRGKHYIMRTNGEMEVELHEFLTLSLDEGERLVSLSGQFTPEITVPVTY